MPFEGVPLELIFLLGTTVKPLQNKASISNLLNFHIVYSRVFLHKNHKIKKFGQTYKPRNSETLKQHIIIDSM